MLFPQSRTAVNETLLNVVIPNLSRESYGCAFPAACIDAILSKVDQGKGDSLFQE